METDQIPYTLREHLSSRNRIPYIWQKASSNVVSMHVASVYPTLRSRTSVKLESYELS